MTPRVRRALRCIETDRSQAERAAASTVHMVKVLRFGGVIVAHPEMGRTLGEANKNKPPLKHGEREMQKIDSRLTEVAHKAGAWILPGWVEVPEWREPVRITTSFRRMFWRKNKRYWPVVYSFGQPIYRPSEPFDLKAENERLQQAIFDA